LERQPCIPPERAFWRLHARQQGVRQCHRPRRPLQGCNLPALQVQQAGDRAGALGRPVLHRYRPVFKSGSFQRTVETARLSSDKIVVAGGAGSGKSAYAQEGAGLRAKDVVYIATASVLDNEMAERVAAHRRARPARWTTVEARFDVARVIREYASPSRCI